MRRLIILLVEAMRARAPDPVSGAARARAAFHPVPVQVNLVADDPHKQNDSSDEPRYNQNSAIRSRWKSAEYRPRGAGSTNGKPLDLKWLIRKPDVPQGK